VFPLRKLGKQERRSTEDGRFLQRSLHHEPRARMKLVETYLTCGSIAETARRWHTSPNLARKWVRRFKGKGLSGLQDRSRRLRSFLSQAPRGNQSQGSGSARIHRLWKEKAFLVPVAGGRLGSLPSHDPDTSCGGKPFILLIRPGKKRGHLRLSRWT